MGVTHIQGYERDPETGCRYAKGSLCGLGIIRLEAYYAEDATCPECSRRFRLLSRFHNRLAQHHGRTL